MGPFYSGEPPGRGSFAPALLNILLLHALCVKSALQYAHYIMHLETKELKSFLRGGGLNPLGRSHPFNTRNLTMTPRYECTIEMSRNVILNPIPFHSQWFT